ncbi:serine/threonine kinase [Aureococcus anophagefferens]|nr:serine/threonine kinase [Aureococcus anophagefferens]
MDAFEEFLTDEHPISEDNRRQVMRQAEKLVSGQGVATTRRPTAGAGGRLPQGRAGPASDIIQVIADARDFEDEHGRDHGNGWLLNHPPQAPHLPDPSPARAGGR